MMINVSTNICQYVRHNIDIYGEDYIIFKLSAKYNKNKILFKFNINIFNFFNFNVIACYENKSLLFHKTIS